ncbi:hypothetical protein AB0J82_20915 [Asanoa sp. NPDC049518]|uniref:8-oxoguanine DNA glycosylase OGG fold protein n=1 Tax=unclassified Asanoa TaxID=2685164 RepID=UPI003422DBC3
MRSSLPSGLPALVRHYRGRQQHRVTYVLSSWKRALATHPGEVDVLEDDQWTRLTNKPGRRCVGRDDVARLIEATNIADGQAARRAFVLVLAWGSGTSNTRSYRNVPRALAAPLCATRLIETAYACRQGDLPAAYAAFSLPDVGRSFFTKWFAFAGQTPDRGWQLLILDDRVLRTLNHTLGTSTRALTRDRRWSHRYAAYVENMHAWSDGLRPQGIACSAERLEWIFFMQNGQPLTAHARARRQLAARPTATNQDPPLAPSLPDADVHGQQQQT